MTRAPTHPNNKGFALFFTLVAITLTSALIAATMFRVTENTQLSRLNTLRLHATSTAESELWAALANPSLTALSASPIGTVKMSTSSTGDATTATTVTKVDTAIVWLVATTNVTRGPNHATHRVALSAQLTPSAPNGRFAVPIPGPSWVDLY